MSQHEQVTRFRDSEVGLTAIVAIHSTALGPALGGVRFWHYASEADALADVLRLSEAMTMKAAVAGLDQGGGKTVVLWDDPHAARTDALLRALGRCVDALGGRYLAAEDVGASPRDMDGIARETAWVTGVDPARGGSGDPSPVTALGVLHAMRATLDTSTLAGRMVVIQGAGHVGTCLARLLVDEGAHVAITDVDRERAEAAGVRAIPPDEVLTTSCDVLAPCALGGVITVEAVAQIRAPFVCGGANNQLADDAAGDALAARGIVYAPDYVVNAGGIINIAREWGQVVDVATIGTTTRHVLEFARAENLTPARAADELARRRIASEGKPPYRPGEPSVMRDALLARRERFR